MFAQMAEFDPRVYWEKRLAGTSGLQGVGYLGLGQAFNQWMYRVRRKVFMRTVRRHVPTPSDLCVLDTGSGTGEYLRNWRLLGARAVEGSDLTEVAVDRLRAEFPDIGIRQLDITEPGALPKDRYDAISCMDVLFHVVDRDRFMQAIANFSAALRPGGLLIISDNFQHAPSTGETHFVARSLDEFSDALIANGLEPMDRRPMFHLLNRPTDSGSPWLHRWWGLVNKVCALSHALGGLLAMLAYPFELLIVSFRNEGVSTEIMVCRKR